MPQKTLRREFNPNTFAQNLIAEIMEILDSDSELFNQQLFLQLELNHLPTLKDAITADRIVKVINEMREDAQSHNLSPPLFSAPNHETSIHAIAQYLIGYYIDIGPSKHRSLGEYAIAKIAKEQDEKTYLLCYVGCFLLALQNCNYRQWINFWSMVFFTKEALIFHHKPRPSES